MIIFMRKLRIEPLTDLLADLLADRPAALLVVSTQPPMAVLVGPMADIQLEVPVLRAVVLREVTLHPTAAAALVRSVPAALGRLCVMEATRLTRRRTRPTQLQRTAFITRGLSRTRTPQTSWLPQAISSQTKSI